MLKLSQRAIKRTFALFLTLSLLAGCGFKLKGFYDVPEALQRVTLAEQSTQPTALGRELISQMTTNGILLTESAPYRLELSSAQYNRRAITLSGRADAEEYELSGRARFALYASGSTEPVLERQVSIERTYADNSNAIALETLESRYRTEINRALAEQILRQYLSFTPSAVSREN